MARAYAVRRDPPDEMWGGATFPTEQAAERVRDKMAEGAHDGASYRVEQVETGDDWGDPDP